MKVEFYIKTVFITCASRMLMGWDTCSINPGSLVKEPCFSNLQNIVEPMTVGSGQERFHKDFYQSFLGSAVVLYVLLS